jgi:hypothetical protein
MNVSVNYNSAREAISAMRGKWVFVPVATVTTASSEYKIIAAGYSNYPEPQYYAITKDGKYIRDESGIMFINYDEHQLLHEYNKKFKDEQFRRLYHSIVKLLEESVSSEWCKQCDSL